MTLVSILRKELEVSEKKLRNIMEISNIYHNIIVVSKSHSCSLWQTPFDSKEDITKIQLKIMLDHTYLSYRVANRTQKISLIVKLWVEFPLHWSNFRLTHPQPDPTSSPFYLDSLWFIIIQCKIQITEMKESLQGKASLLGKKAKE